jgi:hypothetical protein
MHQTLSQHRVRARVSPQLTSEQHVNDEPTAPVSPTTLDRFKRMAKNPLVLVGITWMVMAVLLAREILAR